MATKRLFDILFILEKVEHGDVSHRHDCVTRDATEDQWVAFVLDQNDVVLIELVQFFHRSDALFVLNQTVVLQTVLTTKEDDTVFPLVADPALTCDRFYPLCAGVRLEVRVFHIVLIKDQLWMAQFTSDD